MQTPVRRARGDRLADHRRGDRRDEPACLAAVLERHRRARRREDQTVDAAAHVDERALDRRSPRASVTTPRTPPACAGSDRRRRRGRVGRRSRHARPAPGARTPADPSPSRSTSARAERDAVFQERQLERVEEERAPRQPALRDERRRDEHRDRQVAPQDRVVDVRHRPRVPPDGPVAEQEDAQRQREDAPERAARDAREPLQARAWSRGRSRLRACSRSTTACVRGAVLPGSFTTST